MTCQVWRQAVKHSSWICCRWTISSYFLTSISQNVTAPTRRMQSKRNQAPSRLTVTHHTTQAQLDEGFIWAKGTTMHLKEPLCLFFNLIYFALLWLTSYMLNPWRILLKKKKVNNLSSPHWWGNGSQCGRYLEPCTMQGLQIEELVC